MSQKNNFNDFFSGFNFMMPETSSLFPTSDFNEVFNSGMKFFEEASQISKDLMMKGFDSSNLFSFFENSAEIMNSSYSSYLEMFGFITKDAYDQLVEKYNSIQDEIDKQKKQISQKDSKIKDQDKKLKAVEKDMKDFEKKIKDLENELAAEKINKTATNTNESTKKDVPN